MCDCSGDKENIDAKLKRIYGDLTPCGYGMLSDLENQVNASFSARQFTPPAKPKRRRAKKFDHNKRFFWWTPDPSDINRELLLKKLLPLPLDVIREIFSFTDFWTLSACATVPEDADDFEVDIQKLAEKEIKNRFKF